MIRVSVLAVAVAAAVALSGCLSMGTITDADVGAAYSPQYVNYTARNGEFPTAVYGNPFGDNADAKLLSGLWIPGAFTKAKLTPIPKDQERKDGHLVLLFDPDHIPGGNTACKSPESVHRDAHASTLRLQGAFCYGDEMISQAVLSIARPHSPDDPRFNRAMDQFLAVLFPPTADITPGCSQTKPC